MFPFPRQYPYCPIDALPDLLYNAAYHLHREDTDIPPGVLLTDAIAASAAAVHLSYDVAGPDGRLMPCTINTLAVCRSGLGKGGSYWGFFAPFYQLEAEAGDGSLLLQEVSYRGLMDSVVGKGRNVSIQHEDGASFLDGPLLNDFPDKLTQLWSGKPPVKHKVRGVSLAARDARCSLGMRIQPKIFYPFLIKTSSKTFVQGLWPRAIAACHDPAKFNEPLARFPPPSAAGLTLVTFQDRLKALLLLASERANDGQLERARLVLDESAAAFLIGLKYWLKEWGSEYDDVEEARDRVWENTLRLGAVFHVMCAHQNTAIGLEMVERAWTIVEWSLTQHRKIFVDAIAKPVASAKATRPLTAVRTTSRARPAQKAQLLLLRIEEIAAERGEEWVSLDEAGSRANLTGNALKRVAQRLEHDGRLNTRVQRSQLCCRLQRYTSTGTL